MSIKGNDYWGGFLDGHGNQAIPAVYDFAGYFSEGVCAVNKAGRWFFIDKEGVKTVVLPTNCTQAFSFSEGLAGIVIRKDGSNRSSELLGFIDHAGRLVIPTKFHECGNGAMFHEGLAAVADSGSHLCGFIDKTGRWQILPKFTGAHEFEGGLCAVSVGRDVEP